MIGAIAISTITCIIVIIIIVIIYLYNMKRLNTVRADMDDSMKSIEKDANTTSSNKLETDDRQNELLARNAKQLQDLQKQELQDSIGLLKNIDNLEYIEAEDMMRISNDLTGIKSLRDGNIANIQTNTTGIQSLLTSIGANYATLANTVKAMPIDQQLHQINNIEDSVSNILDYDNANSEAIEQLQGSIIDNYTKLYDIQSEIDNVIGFFVHSSDLDSYASAMTDNYVKENTLGNYVTKDTLTNNYATSYALSDLSSHVTENHRTMTSFNAPKTVTNDLVTSADMGDIYATPEMLVGLSTNGDLRSYILYSNYSANLTNLYHKVDTINSSLVSLPKSYAVKTAVENATSQLLDIAKNIRIAKVQYDQILMNYVP